MKHIVRKLFWNYEKEEKWLNEMSAKGIALTGYSWCRYVFMETSNNEYTYRLELLEKMPNHVESIAYIKFLEENGIEYVASYMRWVYFRRKSSEGAFDIYSDKDSRINHYKRINYIWNLGMLIELILGFSNIVMGIVSLNMGSKLGISNIISGSLLVVLGLFFLSLASHGRKKIIKLKQEKVIRE